MGDVMPGIDMKVAAFVHEKRSASVLVGAVTLIEHCFHFPPVFPGFNDGFGDRTVDEGVRLMPNAGFWRRSIHRWRCQRRRYARRRRRGSSARSAPDNAIDAGSGTGAYSYCNVTLPASTRVKVLMSAKSRLSMVKEVEVR